MLRDHREDLVELGRDPKDLEAIQKPFLPEVLVRSWWMPWDTSSCRLKTLAWDENKWGRKVLHVLLESKRRDSGLLQVF